MSNTSVRLLNNNLTPKVYMDPETLEQINYIVNSVPSEVAWYTFLIILSDGNLLITGNCHIPEQKVTATQAITTTLGEADMMLDVTDMAEKENLTNTCKNLLVHCHSHVNMACTPSAQDNTTLLELFEQFKAQDNPPDYAIKCIFNKKDQHTCEVTVINTETPFVYTTTILPYGDPYAKFTRLKQEIADNVSTNHGANLSKRTHYITNPSNSVSSTATDMYKNLSCITNVGKRGKYLRSNATVVYNEVCEVFTHSNNMVFTCTVPQRNIIFYVIRDALWMTLTQKSLYTRCANVLKNIKLPKTHESTNGVYSFFLNTLQLEVYIDTNSETIGIVHVKSGNIVYNTDFFILNS